MPYVISPSKRKNKKWMVQLPDNKKIHFGDSRYQDFTAHKDERRKKAYLLRHKKEDWERSGIDKAGFWSRWLLWNKSSIVESAKNIANKFNIKVDLKLK